MNLITPVQMHQIGIALQDLDIPDYPITIKKTQFAFAQIIIVFDKSNKIRRRSYLFRFGMISIRPELYTHVSIEIDRVWYVIPGKSLSQPGEYFEIEVDYSNEQIRVTLFTIDERDKESDNA